MSVVQEGGADAAAEGDADAAARAGRYPLAPLAHGECVGIVDELDVAGQVRQGGVQGGLEVDPQQGIELPDLGVHPDTAGVVEGAGDGDSPWGVGVGPRVVDGCDERPEKVRR